ncbi:MAG: hypothetical protein ABWX90_02530 [Candidatus Saccharimonadales bacterium]
MNTRMKTNAQGTVQAYPAKDGSLHLKAIDREISDATFDLSELLTAVAKEMESVAPFSEDFRCNGLFEDWQFKDAIQHLLANDLERLAALVEAAQKLNRLRELKAKDK